MDIPRAWEQLAFESLQGVLLVIGAPDVGKSTFARYLYQRLCGYLSCTAYLDGDPGQSTLGPPTTLTLAVNAQAQDVFPPGGMRRRRFVGAVSPRGHMLPMLVGASRLAQAARHAGAQAIVYDTSGFVAPSQGGLALKLAKIDLLGPTTVFAIQQAHELEMLLVPLRRSRRARVVDLHPSPQAQRRDVLTRRAHRARQFGRYFATGHALVVDWAQMAVLPAPQFEPGQLVALEDGQGFVLALGVVVDQDVRARRVTLHTPLASVDSVDALCLGDVTVDLETFSDRRLDRTDT
jgi:polynucleotide 5'-hydroxyl-kinase GRC3/NOL9